MRKAARQNQRVLAVRLARHKLILHFNAEPYQFFDLQTDSAELHPLPGDNNPAIRRRLLQRAHGHIVKSLRERDLGNRTSLLLRNLSFERPESVRA